MEIETHASAGFRKSTQWLRPLFHWISLMISFVKYDRNGIQAIVDFFSNFWGPYGSTEIPYNFSLDTLKSFFLLSDCFLLS